MNRNYDEDGILEIPDITHTGAWMICINHTLSQTTTFYSVPFHELCRESNYAICSLASLAVPAIDDEDDTEDEILDLSVKRTNKGACHWINEVTCTFYNENGLFNNDFYNLPEFEDTKADIAKTIECMATWIGANPKNTTTTKWSFKANLNETSFMIQNASLLIIDTTGT